MITESQGTTGEKNDDVTKEKQEQPIGNNAILTLFVMIIRSRILINIKKDIFHKLKTKKLGNYDLFFDTKIYKYNISN